MKDGAPEIPIVVMRTGKDDPYTVKYVREPDRPQLYQRLSALSLRATKHGDRFPHGTMMAICAQMRNLEVGTGAISTFMAIIEEVEEELKKIKQETEREGRMTDNKGKTEEACDHVSWVEAHNLVDHRNHIHIIEALTVEEQNRRDQLESVIFKNLNEWCTVGKALIEMRELRLYRSTHSAWNLYLRELYGIGENHGNKLIRATQVVIDIGTAVPTLPENEFQARPLTKISDPVERIRIWTKAVETAPGGKITADHVKAVVQDALGEKVRQKAGEAKTRIRAADGVDEEFKASFDHFMVQLIRVMDGKYATVPKSLVKFYLKSLDKAII